MGFIYLFYLFLGVLFSKMTKSFVYSLLTPPVCLFYYLQQEWNLLLLQCNSDSCYSSVASNGDPYKSLQEDKMCSKHQRVRWRRGYLLPDDRLPSSAPQHWETRATQQGHQSAYRTMLIQYSWRLNFCLRSALWWVTDGCCLLSRERKTNPGEMDTGALTEKHTNC